ncbi:MAG: L,D-transpeptidase family protein [Deltaproteobacteria bacterium]|nr:L,D-transpeptidase family protein [Deltaproteobacteria bacterium]
MPAERSLSMMFRSTFSHRVALDGGDAFSKGLAVLFFLLCSQLFSPRSGFAAQTVAERVSELLRQQIEAWKTPAPETATAPQETNVLSATPDAASPTDAPDPSTATVPTSPLGTQPKTLPKAPSVKLMVGKDILRSAVMLARFYEGRSYQPAWSSDDGPTSQADDLINTIQAEAAREGLQVGNYRLEKLRTPLQQLRQDAAQSSDPHALADFDLLCTDTFLTYGAQVALGKSNLKGLSAEWFAKEQRADLVEVLQQAIIAKHILDALKTLPPSYPGYVKLRAALAQHRDLAARGGWPSIPAGFDLRPGGHDERVPQIRERLRVTGELEATPPHPSRSSHAPPQAHDVYEPTLVRAVKTFQRRHGLDPDGVVGGLTLAALNVPAETRIQQLMVNMHRWRALPPNLGARHIDVNIPNFALTVFEQDRPILSMKVVVGKMIEQRTTPTFRAYMTHVVLNPYWYVPKSIAEKELFPLARKDPRYFAKHNFVVRRVAVGEKQLADPNATDGSTTSTKVYQYLLRQEPGPKNSLGRIKFMFPNDYGVYLHDTPSKELFKRVVRTFSHGCIRVEKPVDLAEYVLRDAKQQWTRDALLATFDQQKQKTVWLSESIPVYIHYWTAWVDDGATVQFRNDIYGYDNVPGAQLPVAIVNRPRPEPNTEAPPIPQPDLSPQPPDMQLQPPATLQPAPPPDTQHNPPQQESSPSVVN